MDLINSFIKSEISKDIGSMYIGLAYSNTLFTILSKDFVPSIILEVMSCRCLDPSRSLYKSEAQPLTAPS
ncbi:MAG: hypothetical protein ACD_7C00324G0001, partial [uncultured bacterium]